VVIRYFIFCFFSCVLILSGCQSSAPTFSPNATLEEKIEITREHLALPGAVVSVRRHEEVVVEAAFGLASLEENEVMTLDHHFRIASITKPVIATVLLLLVDEGKVTLDDPISDYVEGVPEGALITLRELAQHTSGLANYIAFDHVKEAFAMTPEREWQTDELLAFAFAEKPYFEADKDGWMYSNTNYILLGLVIEKVEGTSLNDVIQRRICEPLGLANTYYSTEASFQLSPFARGYQYGDAEGPNYWKGKGELPYDVTHASPSMWHAAGAMVSDLRDTSRMIEAIATGELVSDASFIEQTTWRKSGYPIVEYDYGLGLVRYEGLVGHNGNVPGYQSAANYDPETGTTIVVLTNLYSSPNWEEPADALMFVIYRHLTGRSIAPPWWRGW